MTVGGSSHDKILLEVAHQFGATLDLDHLLALVVARVVALLDAERALFALFDPHFEIERAVTHNMPWEGAGHPLPVSHGALADVVRTRAPVMISDPTPDASSRASESMRMLGLRFIVAVPVLVRDNLVGVLYVDSRVGTVRDVTAKLETLRALAGLVGVAVENARLFAEQRYRTLLLYDLVHDFRAPLSVVQANAEWLAPGLDDPAQREAAADILTSTQRIERMINSTLALSRIDAGADPIEPRAVSLADAVRVHARTMNIVARAKDATLEVRADDALPPAHTVPDRLEIVLDNLVFNALKYVRAGTAVRLSVAARADAGPPEALARARNAAECLFQNVAVLAAAPGSTFLEVSVQNQGGVIPPDVLARLFTPYVRGEEERGGIRATGLGLSIVDECVRGLGGCAWASSSAAAGTRFCFTLPTQVVRAEPARTPG